MERGQEMIQTLYNRAEDRSRKAANLSRRAMIYWEIGNYKEFLIASRRSACMHREAEEMFEKTGNRIQLGIFVIISLGAIGAIIGLIGMIT
jgi:hypothetical protein